MDWNQVLTIVGTNIALILVSLGTTVSLFLWARHEAGEDRKIHNEDRKDILQLIREIKEETSEFKAESKIRMERQDAEYKSHLTHYHKG